MPTLNPEEPEIQSLPIGNIYGTVSDTVKLPNVRISVNDGTYKAITDSAGRYRINNIPGGIYKIKATRRLNDSMEQTITLINLKVISPKAGKMVTTANFHFHGTRDTAQDVSRPDRPEYMPSTVIMDTKDIKMLHHVKDSVGQQE